MRWDGTWMNRLASSSFFCSPGMDEISFFLVAIQLDYSLKKVKWSKWIFQWRLVVDYAETMFKSYTKVSRGSSDYKFKFWQHQPTIGIMSDFPEMRMLSSKAQCNPLHLLCHFVSMLSKKKHRSFYLKIKIFCHLNGNIIFLSFLSPVVLLWRNIITYFSEKDVIIKETST